MRTVLHVVGARPNFMKLAPVYRAIRARNRLPQLVVHTGQHYDEKMSDVFFRDLGLEPPDLHLGVGSGSHAEQTARTMIELEKVMVARRPRLISVFGDVNSTVAAALVAAKLQIPVAHVEAGLRSFDRTMPEEINRVVVDRVSDFLLTPSPDADENLRNEGARAESIHRVGNVMIDSLLLALPAARALRMPEKLDLHPRQFALCTLHRPSNVDDPNVLGRILEALGRIAERIPLLFPVHPRTRAKLGAMGAIPAGIRLLEPLGYNEFLSLMSEAAMLLTDSGGIQEESTALGVPCLTLRENTERPITVSEGTNTVVGTDSTRIVAEALSVLETGGKRGRVPALWDGRTGERIAALYERWTA